MVSFPQAPCVSLGLLRSTRASPKLTHGAHADLEIEKLVAGGHLLQSAQVQLEIWFGMCLKIKESTRRIARRYHLGRERPFAQRSACHGVLFFRRRERQLLHARPLPGLCDVGYFVGRHWLHVVAVRRYQFHLESLQV